MNIFVLDYNPQLCARMHADKHVVKMILETAQLLSTAIQRCSPYPLSDIYNITHVSHPCAKWTRASQSNFLWLQALGTHLCKEYSYRYKKEHKSEAIIHRVKDYLQVIPEGGFTERPQCMPDIYKEKGDPITAYRNYYLGEKTHILKYTRRHVPEWITTMGLGEHK